MVYAFEWDEAKRAANLAEHGIDFAEVARVDGAGRVVAFTRRDGRIRVISLRRAREREI